eukprot:TRINITY_DN1492_c0_g1_i1.p1 TRINITY_DN1492_c0_g1~~TRINITY_DN1492_c0_g1_i1.p1  ORF type:complete len:329 (+),score=119.22 TRINITY_DN1492_c0_g1_i1:702-1688(+)
MHPVLVFLGGIVIGLLLASVGTEFSALRIAESDAAPSAERRDNTTAPHDAATARIEPKKTRKKDKIRDAIEFRDWKERTVSLTRRNSAGKQQLKVNDGTLRGTLAPGEVFELHHHTFGGPWALGRDIFGAVRQVVRPHHRLLDAGCGSLRFGVHMIEYLDRDGYTGFDIDTLSIDAAVRYEVPFHGFAERKRPRLFAASILDALDRFERDDVTFNVMLFFKVFMHLPKQYGVAESRKIFTRILARLEPPALLLCEKPLFTFKEMDQLFNVRVQTIVDQVSWFSRERNVTLFALGAGVPARKYDLMERRKMRIAETYLNEKDDDDDDTL